MTNQLDPAANPEKQPTVALVNIATGEIVHVNYADSRDLITNGSHRRLQTSDLV